MGTDTHPAAGACALKEAAAHTGALLQFLKDWIPQEGAHAGAMEECRERVAMTKCHELTTTAPPLISLY